MNMLAEKLGLDPTALRLEHNALRENGNPPWPALKLDGPPSLPAVLHRALELAGPKPNLPNDRVGRGVACAMPAYDIASGAIPGLDHSVVELEWRPDGRLTARCESVDFGEGTATLLAQIIGQELQLPATEIDFVMGDTAAVPETGRRVASSLLRRPCRAGRLQPASGPTSRACRRGTRGAPGSHRMERRRDRGRRRSDAPYRGSRSRR